MTPVDMPTKRNAGAEPANVALLIGFLVTAWRLRVKDVAAAGGVQRGNLSSFVHSLAGHRNVSMEKLKAMTFDVLRCHSNGVLAAGLHCWVISQSKWLSGGLRVVLAANLPPPSVEGASVEFVRSGEGSLSTGTLVVRPSESVMVVARIEPDAVDVVEEIVREISDERARHGRNGVSIRPADIAEGVRMRDAWMSVRDFGAHQGTDGVRPVLDVVEDIRLRAVGFETQVDPAPIF